MLSLDTATLNGEPGEGYAKITPHDQGETWRGVFVPDRGVKANMPWGGIVTFVGTLNDQSGNARQATFDVLINGLHVFTKAGKKRPFVSFTRSDHQFVGTLRL